MVDATEAMESSFLTPDIVERSKKRKLVIISEGEYMNDKYGRKLTIKVNIDAKEKVWRPNKESVEKMSEAWGIETEDWIGKSAKLDVVLRNDKKTIIARPVGSEDVFSDGTLPAEMDDDVPETQG